MYLHNGGAGAAREGELDRAGEFLAAANASEKRETINLKLETKKIK